jgi:hypothetical protein
MPHAGRDLLPRDRTERLRGAFRIAIDPAFEGTPRRDYRTPLEDTRGLGDRCACGPHFRRPVSRAVTHPVLTAGPCGDAGSVDRARSRDERSRSDKGGFVGKSRRA